jgi:hypothetical protein
MAKLIFLLLFTASVILIIFPLKNRGNNLYANETSKGDPFYITEYKNRYFYHDFFGEIVFIGDVKIPNIPIIKFSDDLNNEVKINTDLSNLESGNYLLINKVLIKED